MSFLKRLFGICATKSPADPECWTYQNGTVTIDLKRAPELGQPNGAIRLEGRGLENRMMVFKSADGGYKAVKNKCTHMGRRVDPLPGTDKLQCCSVNKTTYSLDGAVLSGPGKAPLSFFNVEQSDQSLVIKTH